MILFSPGEQASLAPVVISRELALPPFMLTGGLIDPGELIILRGYGWHNVWKVTTHKEQIEHLRLEARQSGILVIQRRHTNARSENPECGPQSDRT